MSAAHAPCYAMLGVASFIVPQRLSLDTRVSSYIGWVFRCYSLCSPWDFSRWLCLPSPLLSPPSLGFSLDIWNWLVTRRNTTHSRRHLSTLALTYNIWRLHTTFMPVTSSGLLSLGDIITSSLLRRISNDPLSLPRTEPYRTSRIPTRHHEPGHRHRITPTHTPTTTSSHWQPIHVRFSPAVHRWLPRGPWVTAV
ncbi:hypothetical protein BC629DRAFT_612616 [Irpex lacteus]|nr:hypothetical protein BC629DRAFT_612616 [Irpex lacteus]